MSEVDLVFEGGGAKGFVLAGAVDALLTDTDHTPGRLLGTSAGAITATFLAAEYSMPEMQATMAEKDANGRSVFESFLGDPPPVTRETARNSAIRKLLRDLDIPYVPEFAESKIDDWLAEQLSNNEYGRHLFSFVDRGGWYSADAFVAWLQRKLSEGKRPDGSVRNFGGMTLSEFFAATQHELTLVASDTTNASMLLLNHRTAPDLPVVWATRMSMSIPLLWQEVVWDPSWGSYFAWNGETDRLEPNDMTGHTIVDGGMLSNFPIALFLAERSDVSAVVGPPRSKNVLGLLIDDSVDVPNRPVRPEDVQEDFSFGELTTFQRIQRLISTATGAHDNMAIALFNKYVVHLPAGGYGTTQFDMTDAEREALIKSGSDAMRKFLASQSILELAGAGPDFTVSADAAVLANAAAGSILLR